MPTRPSLPALACALVHATGCDPRALQLDPGAGLEADAGVGAPVRCVDAPSRPLDLLFVVDNSPSMREEQDSLRRSFPAFMDVLRKLPGGLPDVRIAVVSTDLGAGPVMVPSCNRVGGDRGAFRANPGCGLAPGARGIEARGGERVKNYDGDLAIKKLKGRPEQVVVSGIFGWPEAPATARYGIGRRELAGQALLGMLPVCQSPNGVADPGVRLKAFVDAFGPNGSVHSICAEDLNPALRNIGERVKAVVCS